MDAQNKITATETQNTAQELSNNDSQRWIKTEKFLRGVVRPGINIFGSLFVKLVQLACWILIPMAAIAFADVFSQQFGTYDTHGQLAVIATYGVAVVAGIKGAAEASAQIGTFKINV